MPPKHVRRPVAGAKAVAKAKARARAGVLRRPALARETEEKGFEDYGEVKTSCVPAADLLRCGRVVVTHAVYWKDSTKAMGTFQALRAEGEETWAELKLEGTLNEHLLKFLTGVPSRTIRAHLCHDDCGQETSGDDVIHIVKLKKLKTGEEEDWMRNLLAAGRQDADELRALRLEANAGRSPSPGEREDRVKEKKKEKKSDSKKEKDRRQGDGKKRKSASPLGRRRRGRSLEVAFGGSGLDPDPRLRRRYLKQARRVVKKRSKKKKSTSSSSTASGKDKESSSSGLSSMGVGTGEVFGQSRMAKRIALKCPGVLTATSLGAIQDQLLTSQGQLWDVDKRELPPFFLQFFRARWHRRCGERDFTLHTPWIWECKDGSPK